MTIYLTTSPETSTSPPPYFLFGKGERRRLVWPDTNFWCWLQSAISPFPLKLLDQSSKAYGKSGAAKPQTPCFQQPFSNNVAANITRNCSTLRWDNDSQSTNTPEWRSLMRIDGEPHHVVMLSAVFQKCC